GRVIQGAERAETAETLEQETVVRTARDAAESFRSLGCVVETRDVADPQIVRPYITERSWWTFAGLVALAVSCGVFAGTSFLLQMMALTAFGAAFLWEVVRLIRSSSMMSGDPPAKHAPLLVARPASRCGAPCRVIYLALLRSPPINMGAHVERRLKAMLG